MDDIIEVHALESNESETRGITFTYKQSIMEEQSSKPIMKHDSETLVSIHSMLSMDDTILNSIITDQENDTDEQINSSDTMIKRNATGNSRCERTCSIPDDYYNDWELFPASRILDSTQLQKDLEKKVNDTQTLNSIQGVQKYILNDERKDVVWQDETLLNQVSTEIEFLDSTDNKINTRNMSPKCIYNNEAVENKNQCYSKTSETNVQMLNFNQTDLHVQDSSASSKNMYDELALDTSIFHDIEIVNTPINNCLRYEKANNIKDSIKNEKNTFPSPDSNKINKKRRLESNDEEKQQNGGKCDNIQKFKDTGSFYGLPDKVKTLIFKTKGITALYQWQDECLNLEAVKNRKNLIYALPTSGGKTLVAEILMLREIICNKKNAIFILPFVAIVQEKVRLMFQLALELSFLIEEYAAGKGQYPPKKRRRKNSIYICTIEKSLGLINSLIELKRLGEIGIIVVDELHLLGENGGRGATLEGLLTKVMYVDAKVHIVGMSATIGNLNEVAEFLKADVYTQNFRPVQIKEYVKCDDNIWLIDLKEEEIFSDLKKINYRYSQEAAKLDPDKIGGLVMDVIPNDSCLIFCSSRKNCENVALLLIKVLVQKLENHKTKEKSILLRALRAEGVVCPILEKTIPFGIAYHHSGLTSEERKLLEEAFLTGTLCLICCTSTLAAGVNLPARRVILRCPYVGNQFLNLSRYKQMVGRAGRAGMGEIGESILICKSGEIPKVKELLTSKMDDSISTLHVELSRGLNNLILSSILLSLATNRHELHKLVGTSLLGVQQGRLNVKVKTLTDKTITMLMKAGVIKIKQTTTRCDAQPNLTVVLQSQDLSNVEKTTPVKGKRTVVLTSKTSLEICQLGRAAMKGSVDLDSAYDLYRDLKIAQRHLVLLNELHLLYLITPYDLANQIKPVGSVYYDVVTNLTPEQMETARTLRINEMTVCKLRDGITPKNVEAKVIQRFYLTLILHEILNQHLVHTVAEKYQVSRGIVQNLVNSASSFASGIVRFCEEIPEFWPFKVLLSTFSQKLMYCCCSEELESLMELPSVKAGRARQLFNAGYKTLQSIAMANSKEMIEKIEYLPKKTANQIIAAANLLILEKVENLRDEAENFLEGLDPNCIM